MRQREISAREVLEAAIEDHPLSLSEVGWSSFLLQRDYRDYFDYSEAASKIPPHRVLALNRGESIDAMWMIFPVDFSATSRRANCWRATPVITPYSWPTSPGRGKDHP